MTVYTKKIVLPKTHELDIINITDRVQLEVERSGIKNGIAQAFVIGSTGSIVMLEYEPGLVADIKTALERIVPSSVEYEHQRLWHDWNGHSHIRASLLGPSMSVPIQAGVLLLGTWQQMVYVELDQKPRNREVAITVIGE